MPKKLTVSELSSELGVSVNTIWKKIKKRGLTTVKDSVNNREITFVLLSDEEFDELLQEKNSTSGMMNGVNNPNYEDSETIHEGSVTSESQSEMYLVMDRFMEYSRDMNEQVKEYIERVINAETQIKLLEDLENRKNSQIHEILAENKQLRLKVKDLEEKLKAYEAKWWNKGIMKLK